MPLIYSIVARESTILAEFSSAKGTFDQIARKILEKIPTQANSKMSYVYEKYIFHYLVDEGLIYLCMADEEFGRRIPFAYLEELKNRFKATYKDRGKTAVAYGMNVDFSKVMKTLMDFYSNPKTDRIGSLQGEIDEVKSVMVGNIDKILERGDKIELLVDKTSNLSSEAFRFRKSSGVLKRTLCISNIKLIIFIVVLALLLVYIIAAIACGGIFFQGCTNKH